MQIHIPDNCGNSPRSLLAIEIAVSLAASKYEQLEPLLAENFLLSIAGEEEVGRSELSLYMKKRLNLKSR